MQAWIESLYLHVKNGKGLMEITMYVKNINVF